MNLKPLTYADLFAKIAKQPVIKTAVQELQIVECRSGRSDGIPALVLPPVLFEPETSSGIRHDLPQTRGTAG